MALEFGTSGLRGLVVEMTEVECRAYTAAFLGILRKRGLRFSRVALAGDLRSSTPSILQHLTNAIVDCGLEVDFIGFLPTPALALYAFHHQIPGIVVTGSHIPDDRNGIKFYLPSGEILKSDEQEISSFRASNNESLVRRGNQVSLPKINGAGRQIYFDRYKSFWGTSNLSSLRIGLYEHSAVGRDILAEILTQAGAEVVRLGRSDEFIPVDTEAVENIAKLKSWVQQYSLDALVSTDGDSDRPLLVDNNGDVWGGDKIGLLVAKALGADVVVTPISSTSGIELSGAFQKIERTRIGSPFVIEGMNKYSESSGTIVGFEANGGFFLGANKIGLAPLLTRDAVLPLLTVLQQAVLQGKKISELGLSLPQRYNQSGLVRGIDKIKAERILLAMKSDPFGFFRLTFAAIGDLQRVDLLDGVKFIMTNSRSIHFRPSGNAPEFRVYAEAESALIAKELSEIGSRWVNEFS